MNNKPLYDSYNGKLYTLESFRMCIDKVCVCYTACNIMCWLRQPISRWITFIYDLVKDHIIVD